MFKSILLTSAPPPPPRVYQAPRMWVPICGRWDQCQTKVRMRADLSHVTILIFINVSLILHTKECKYFASFVSQILTSQVFKSRQIIYIRTPPLGHRDSSQYYIFMSAWARKNILFICGPKPRAAAWQTAAFIYCIRTLDMIVVPCKAKGSIWVVYIYIYICFWYIYISINKENYITIYSRLDDIHVYSSDLITMHCSAELSQYCWTSPANTKHLYNICTTSNQRQTSMVQMLYKRFVSMVWVWCAL